ncbi:hypothetical protein BDN72DRAFT_828458 [Pluteus cervinus]|uniref:Uncharacterized protein n=1 Tax=Pluteus cervinus TaxID=181527 RepID=A0ACD3A671_9AGAR|nr:hypothetical protein BDN72DRAFT_828458 [Pluteus cervinus]
MSTDHERTETEATIAPEPSPTSSKVNVAAPDGPLLDPAAPVAPSLAGTLCVPPQHAARTLVLCFDGTGDQFDSDNSNIVQLFTMLKKDDRSQQMVYYQAGIGTYTSPQVATPLASKISKAMDEAIAWNLDAHVMEGYEFLMQNYTAGDRICIFGFSRGAYTARSLAGMIHKVGLLPACNHQQVPFAYKMYTTEDEVGWQQSNAFKKAFSIDVDIEFVGVWDTVNSVGLFPRRLPFTTSNTIVKTFRHAVSLDERRAKFKANLWNRPNAKEQTLSVSDQAVAQLATVKAKNPQRKESLWALERQYGGVRAQPTDVEEVWFAGCHCDVGGGSVGNDTKYTLARIPLRWMIRECFKTNSGIMFDPIGLQSIGLEPNKLWPEVLPRPPALAAPSVTIQRIPSNPTAEDATARELSLPSYSGDEAHTSNTHLSEEELDVLDGMSPVYDQLSIAPFWWALEVFPIKQRRQKGDASWLTSYGFNMGRGRTTPQKLKIHRSVKARLEGTYEDGGKYVPNAELNVNDLSGVTWVD